MATRLGGLAAATLVSAILGWPAGLVPAGRAQAAAGRDAPEAGTLSPGDAFSERSGASLYANLCQGCHMPEGAGAAGAGAYPALARNADLASADYLASVIVHGQRGMPGFGWGLDDAQVAAVATYVRTHFGNDGREPVTAADAARARR